MVYNVQPRLSKTARKVYVEFTHFENQTDRQLTVEECKSCSGVARQRRGLGLDYCRVYAPLYKPLRLSSRDATFLNSGIIRDETFGFKRGGEVGAL